MNTDLASLEWSLISGKWLKNAPAPSTVASQLARDAIDGKFAEIFSSAPACELFTLKHALNEEEGFSSALPLRIENALDSEEERELATLVVGVACLESFIQQNWTGPNLDAEPHELLVYPSSSNDHLDATSLNRLAIAELAFGGEPAYHLAQKASFLRIAQLIFSLPFHHLQSVPWWILRVTTIHQQILDEPAGINDAFFHQFDSLLPQLEPLGEDLAGRFILEQGLLHHTLSNDRTAAEFFVRAARALGLEYELTGALGKRTKWQQNELSQLVLLAESRKREDDEPEKDVPSTDVTSDATKQYPEALPLNDDTLLEQTQFTSSQSASSSKNSPLAHLDPGNQPALHPLDQSILLGLCLNVRNTQPEHGLTAEQMMPYVDRVISHPRNWSVYTMALLIRSRLEANRSRTVERSIFQLQALVDQMPTADSTLSERLLYVHAILLPSKWEMERELAIRYLSMGVVRSAMEIFERLEMWEEVVKCWQSMERPEKGVAIVRDLLEGRKAESDTVLARGKATSESRREKLDTAREAKLWCLLGDLEPTVCFEHYTKAWEVSGHKSGRAARSLGGYHFAREEFAKAIPCLQQSAAINPLNSRTWFLLGCACLREENWLEARDAFARCVNIDEDDGESWNNLASVYLQMGTAGMKVIAGEDDEKEDVEDSGNDEKVGITEVALVNGNSNKAPERIPFANKMLAHRALKQGLKFSYDNWRMWQNYLIVSMDVGELAEACRALGRIVEELHLAEGHDSVDLDALDRLVNAVVMAEESEDTDAETNPNEGKRLFPRVLDLFTRTILPRISDSPRIFRAYARLLTWAQQNPTKSATPLSRNPALRQQQSTEPVDRWPEILDAYLNAYNCSVGTDERVETDLEKWREAVGEVEDFADVLRNLGPRMIGESSSGGAAGNANWRFQARSMVRTFMGRTKGSFGDEPEWERLTDLLEDLKGSG